MAGIPTHTATPITTVDHTTPAVKQVKASKVSIMGPNVSTGQTETPLDAWLVLKEHVQVLGEVEGEGSTLMVITYQVSGSSPQHDIDLKTSVQATQTLALVTGMEEGTMTEEGALALLPFSLAPELSDDHRLGVLRL